MTPPASIAAGGHLREDGSGFDATITVTNVTDGKGPVGAGSLIGIMSIGAKQGT